MSGRGDGGDGGDGVAGSAVPHLLVRDEADVRIITIDRPERKNALTQAMRDALVDLVADADASAAVRVIVITATDPVFSAGVDVEDPRPPTTPVGLALRPNPAAALRASRTPSICAVNGACVSGALEIALSATMIVASERARFADTHASIGAVPAWGLTALLPRAVGVRKASELSVTGAFVDADEAMRLGLVNHVVPHDELLARTLELAGRIAATPAVREVLALHRRGEGLSLAEALALEQATVAGRIPER